MLLILKYLQFEMTSVFEFSFVLNFCLMFYLLVCFADLSTGRMFLLLFQSSALDTKYAAFVVST